MKRLPADVRLIADLRRQVAVLQEELAASHEARGELRKDGEDAVRRAVQERNDALAYKKRYRELVEEMLTTGLMMLSGAQRHHEAIGDDEREARTR